MTLYRQHGLLATDTPVLDEVAQMALLHNMQQRLSAVSETGFQQMLGPFGPTATEDGIGFTDETARTVCRHFRENGLLCHHLVVRAADSETHSLVVARTARGLDRALRAARKAALRERARLFLAI